MWLSCFFIFLKQRKCRFESSVVVYEAYSNFHKSDEQVTKQVIFEAHTVERNLGGSLKLNWVYFGANLG